MAPSLYTSFKELVLSGGIDFTNDIFRVLLIDTGVYVFSAAHSFRDDVTGVIAISEILSGVTVTGGVVNADNGLATSITGNSIEAVILYRDVGTAATDNLVGYIDGLNLTPDGNNININWHNSGIFAL